MLVFGYDEETGEFTGEVEAAPNPRRKGAFLFPAHTTETEPPPPRDGYARVFTGGTWDYRFVDPVAETVTDSPAPRPIDIKAEALRRILAIAPDWKQRNLIAQAAEFAIKLAEGGTLTAAEQDKRAAGEAIWSQIKSIRAASDELEAMNPIPDDFASNEAHWPGPQKVTV